MSSPVRVAVTGASGLIGSALTQQLRGSGADVVSLVRRPARRAEERQWDPDSAVLDPDVLADCYALVSLHGAGIGDRRWSPAYKTEVLTSRTHGTTALAEALAALAQEGTTVRWVSGSAVGFYGDRGEERLDETSTAGDGFLAEVVRAWEGATEPATAAGVPVARIRTGIVLSRSGGAMAPLLRMLRLGVGGPFGRGRAWWPWITLEDHVRAVTFLLEHPEITGPVNLVAPDVARQGDVVRAIASAMRRPAILPVPPLALRLVMGEFAGDILASQRVTPSRLLAAGFDFRQPTVAAAAAWLTSPA